MGLSSLMERITKLNKGLLTDEEGNIFFVPQKLEKQSEKEQATSNGANNCNEKLELSV